MNVKPNEPIQHVKELVRDSLHIPVESQRLFYQSRALDIAQRLSDYHVPNRAVLVLRFSPVQEQPRPHPHHFVVFVRHPDGHKTRYLIF